MAFPTTDQGIESRFIPADGTSTAVSAGNVGIARDNFVGRQSGAFELVYRAKSEAERDAFFTDYDTAPGQFTLTWDLDSSTHTVIYAGAPVATYREDANAWDVVVRLIKVPNFGGNILLENGDVLLLENDDNLLLEG